MARLLPSIALALPIVAASSMLATPACAGEPAAPSTAMEVPPAEPSATSERRWYGYQTLAIDGAAVGFGVLSGISDGRMSRTVFDIAGVGTYLLGGPFVHLAHGHIGKGLGSFGIRVGAPLACLLIATMLGAAAAPNNDGGAKLGGAVTGVEYGMLFGVVTASILDFAILAHEDVPRGTAADPNPRANPSARTFAPTFAVSREAQGSGARTTFGLAGTF